MRINKFGGPQIDARANKATVLWCIVCIFLSVQHSLFHDLHELLVSGEVAGMFEREEMEGITSQLQDTEKLNTEASGSVDWETPFRVHSEALWNMFVKVQSY